MKNILYSPYLNSNSKTITTTMDQTRIRVVVRKRPISKKESSKNDVDILERRGTDSIAVKELK